MRIHSYFADLCRLALFAAPIGLATLSCSKGESADPAAAETDFKAKLVVSVAIDKAATSSASYRPGEAVVAAVQVQNMTGGSRKVWDLGNESVEFFMTRVGDPVRQRRFPVFSKYERNNQEIELAGGQSKPRNFVLTQLTTEPGDYALAVAYNTEAIPLTGTGEESSRKYDTGVEPKIWSEPVMYRVEGARVFERDSKGVLTQKDAVNVVLNEFKRPVSDWESRLVWNEAGFLDWWVCATIAPQSLTPGEAPKQAWFVNPYRGVVRQAADVNLPVAEVKDESRIKNKVPTAESMSRREQPSLSTPR